MATYTLIPSSLTGYSMQYASNAYTDTDSTTYAEIDFASGQQDYYLGGFVSLPPVENVTSVVVKLKACLYFSDPSYRLQATLLSAPDGIALSDTITISSATATVYTLTLTASAETVASYADTLCLHLYNVDGVHKVYGADITIEADLKIFKSKIIYGNETLIDLTDDTVTEYDVASGYTFHLPSGCITTGDLIVTRTLTATTSTTSAQTVSFEGLVHEPLWFMLACTNTNTTARSYRIMHVVYDGTTTTVYYGRSSTAGSINSATSDIWTYSSGTITFTFTSQAYFGAADWTLYYL